MVGNVGGGSDSLITMDNRGTSQQRLIGRRRWRSWNQREGWTDCEFWSAYSWTSFQASWF